MLSLNPFKLKRLLNGKSLKRFPVTPVEGTPVHPLAIVTIVRNEEGCLAEWLDFHEAQGVTHVYVYDNESTDGTRRVLFPYVERGFVTVLPWLHRKGLHTQARAFAHALSTYGGACRWMAFIDVDEFLYRTEGGSLPEFLSAFEKYPALLVHRYTYGTSGHHTPPEAPVTEAFVWRVSAPAGPFHMHGNMAPKSIVQPRFVTAANGAHRFILKGTRASGHDETGEALTGRDAPAFRAERIRINHYYTKDRQTFLRRISRGPTASNIMVTEARWLELLEDVEKHVSVRDDSIRNAAPVPAARSRAG